MQRACMVGGCPHPAVRGRSRCRVHGVGTPRGPSQYGYAWQQLRERAKALLPMVCGVCHRPINGQAHLDHVLPRSLGGQDIIDNVQWTHEFCNISKGGRNRKLRRV
jgi:5-methylcytosine-specific restriction endonuclease McrA